jgi:hypothetical protein
VIYIQWKNQLVLFFYTRLCCLFFELLQKILTKSLHTINNLRISKEAIDKRFPIPDRISMKSEPE